MKSHGFTMQGPLITEKLVTLPTPTLDDAGREVFVTSDGKRYYCDGATWSEYPTQDYVINKQTFKNKIGNGDFQWWQRGVSFPPSVASPYVADRWRANTRTGCVKSTDIPTGQGFYTSAEWTSETNAYNLIFYTGMSLPTTGAAGEFYNGSTWTLSGWVKCNETRNLKLNIRFGDSLADVTNPVYVGGSGATIYTIPDTNWNYFTYTFDVDVDPVGTNTCLVLMPYILANNSSVPILKITGWQLEKGSVATPYEFIDVALSRVQVFRYFESIPTGSWPQLQARYGLAAANYSAGGGLFLAQKRVSPTMTITGTITYANCSALGVAATTSGFRTSVTVTANGAYAAHGYGLTADAEF